MRTIKQSADQLVLTALNRHNAFPFTASADNLIFGKPAALLDDENNDTSLALRGIQDREYRPDTSRIFYHKLDLAVLFQGNFTPRFSALGQSRFHALLPELNRVLGTAFTEDDLDDINIAQLGEGDEITLELRAKPGSLAYRGITRVIFDRRRILLTDVITKTIFDELTHPDPILDGFTSAGLLTWGLDFTLIWEDLQVSRLSNWRRGQWSYLTRLQASLAANYGIDNWPANETGSLGTGRLTRYDTRSVPGANTDFRYVVVQTNIRTNGYVGTAYFHYNQPT